MIASRRGVLMLLALALGTGIAVAVDALRTPAVVDFALMPGFNADEVTELSWSSSGVFASVHRQQDRWVWGETKMFGRLDPTAVANVLATLRGARIHRRAALPERVTVLEVGRTFPTAGKVTVVLGVISEHKTTQIGIAAEVAGSEQTWLVKDGEELLVDSWVARSLASMDLLAVRNPLDASAATSIELADRARGFDLVLEGQPRRLRAGIARATGGVWVDPALARKLESALDELTFVRRPLDAPSGPPGFESWPYGLEAWLRGPADRDPHGLVISTSDDGVISSIWSVGRCPDSSGQDLIAVYGPVGSGCVDGARWRAIEGLADVLARSAQSIADPRPVPLTKPERFEFLDEGELSLDGHARVTIGGHASDADPERIAELLEAATSRAEVVDGRGMPPAGSAAEWRRGSIDVPIKKHLHAIEVKDRGGQTVTLDVLPDHLVLRREDGLVLRLAPKFWEVLARPLSALRDPTLWMEDPSTITKIALDRVTYTRGAVLGEWTREPAGAVDGPLVEALAATLAQVRAPSSEAPVAAAHHVVVTFAPPVGSPSHHALEVGSVQAAGCAARVDGRLVTLPVKLCMAVDAVAR